MNIVFSSCFALLLFVFSPSILLADIQNSELPECIVLTHCVLENWRVDNVEESFAKLVDEVAKTPRTKIVEKTSSYMHAEAQTKWRRYTDDLLVKAIPEKDIIQVRSESRVGVGDNGVNQKRVNKLAYGLRLDQIT